MHSRCGCPPLRLLLGAEMWGISTPSASQRALIFLCIQSMKNHRIVLCTTSVDKADCGIAIDFSDFIVLSAFSCLSFAVYMLGIHDDVIKPCNLQLCICCQRTVYTLQASADCGNLYRLCVASRWICNLRISKVHSSGPGLMFLVQADHDIDHSCVSMRAQWW